MPYNAPKKFLVPQFNIHKSRIEINSMIEWVWNNKSFLLTLIAVVYLQTSVLPYLLFTILAWSPKHTPATMELAPGIHHTNRMLL